MSHTIISGGKPSFQFSVRGYQSIFEKDRCIRQLLSFWGKLRVADEVRHPSCHTRKGAASIERKGEKHVYRKPGCQKTCETLRNPCEYDTVIVAHKSEKRDMCSFFFVCMCVCEYVCFPLCFHLSFSWIFFFTLLVALPVRARAASVCFSERCCTF
jgi:hypothetical protein